jgi:hypothetical protein
MMRRILAVFGLVGGMAIPAMASSYSNAVTALGPDAYWRMQDTSGVGTDQVGNAHPLNNFNGITRGTAGPSLPGMELNELSYGFSGGSGADTSNTPYVPVTGTGARTEILWAQETTSVATLGGIQNLSEYGVYSGSANQFTAFSLGIDSGYDYINGGGSVGYDVFTLNIQGRQVEATTTPIVPGTWYMLAAVFPNGLTTLGNAQLYVNGVPQSLIDDTSAVPATATGADALPFRVGQWHGGYGLNGDETEMSFFDNALSGSQIQGLYNTATGNVPEPASMSVLGVLSLIALRRRR